MYRQLILAVNAVVRGCDGATLRPAVCLCLICTFNIHVHSAWQSSGSASSGVVIVVVAAAGARRASGECAHLVFQGSDGGEKVGYLFGGG